MLTQLVKAYKDEYLFVLSDLFMGRQNQGVQTAESYIFGPTS